MNKIPDGLLSDHGDIDSLSDEEQKQAYDQYTSSSEHYDPSIGKLPALYDAIVAQLQSGSYVAPAEVLALLERMGRPELKPAHEEQVYVFNLIDTMTVFAPADNNSFRAMVIKYYENLLDREPHNHFERQLKVKADFDAVYDLLKKYRERITAKKI